MVNHFKAAAVRWLPFILGVFVGLVFLVGCSSVATHDRFYDAITSELRNQNFDQAVLKLEDARENNKYSKKDRFLYYIDAGLAHHYALGFDTSNSRFSRAEAIADDLFTKSISRAAVSVLLNDNVLEYAGEDHEILYANLMAAMNYLAVNKFDDAFVEIRRANEMLDLLEQKYAKAARDLKQGAKDDSAGVIIDYTADKVRFNNDAFARYLSMHMYAAEGLSDDARIDRDLMVEAFRTQPHIYDFAIPEVIYQSSERAVLSVVAMTGLCPTKEAVNLRIRTDKDLNLVQILYTDSGGATSEYGHIPMKVSADYYFKFAIPRMVSQPSQVSAIRVVVNGDVVGSLQLIEDVGKIAVETFRAKKSLIYLRSVARAVAKGLASHKLKKKLDTGGLTGWLKKAAIDATMDVTENADLRCSHLLPGQIYVGDFEIEPGNYDITVEFLDAHNAVIGSNNFADFPVTKDYFNLAEAVLLR